jgi:hypothetical protein
LKGRRKLPPEEAPSAKHVYDEHLQIWIERRSGLPVVSQLRAASQPSQFGETTLTETREGADQSEITALYGSRFGETTVTKTMEGTDQIEIASLRASPFGETTVTATLEGADRPEIAALYASQFGETTLTRTQEGHDQSENTRTLFSGGPGKATETEIGLLSDIEINALNSHL